MRNDSGFLFEGFVLSELLKSGIKTDIIKFWQDKNRHEVDIILDFVSKQIPIEIKYKENLKKDDFLGLKTFCDMYPEAHTPFLINLDRQEQDKKYELILPYDLSFLKTDLTLSLS
jgi:predicted AAA+ superfamily ATPase